MPELFRFPLLHAGGVDPTGWLWSDWNVEPTIAIGSLALAGGYLYVTRGENPARPVTRAQKTSFILGALTLFVALGPPLDDWSDHYLLLAHMVQHLLLVLLAAPLLLYGIPGWLLEPLTRNRVTNAIGYRLTRPVVAFTIANAVFVLWHVPMFYEMALRSQPVHVLEHATMLATALLAWWPILGPLPQWPRLALPLHTLYYFAMTLPSAAVGAFITFADPGLYVPYDTARRIFGIDLATDQQAAGLLMWVAVSAIYLLLITYSFFRWASREEAADAEAARLALAPSPANPIPERSGSAGDKLTRLGGLYCARSRPGKRPPPPDSPDCEATMIYLPSQRDDNEESDGAAAVWAFLLTLFFFKLATVVLIFWHMRTWEAGLFLGSTLWYFFPPLILLGAGPALFYYRLRKVRARREALRRAEWMELEPENPGVPTHRRH